MSMLAEPRWRKKLVADPRNLNWSNDDSKFGQKLMEKMGWQKGRGLGANQDGRTEHIRIIHKTDTKGVGCSHNHANNWVAHQDDFNTLLANLNSGGDNAKLESQEPVKVLNLEEKSKSSKKRVHYGKFARGKDLSSLKDGDFDMIFGRRKAQSAPVTPQNVSTCNSDVEDERPGFGFSLPANESKSKENKDGLFGVPTTTSATNVHAYFAKKMADLKARTAGQSASSSPLTGQSASSSPLTGQSDVKEIDSDQSNSREINQSDERVSEELKQGGCDTEESQCVGVDNSEEVTSKKKKKKSKKRKREREEDGSNGEQKTTKEEAMQDLEEQPPKKKKKSPEKETLEDPCVILSEKDTKKEKKRKNKKETDSSQIIELGEREASQASEICSVSEIGKKKKRRKRKEEENGDSENIGHEHESDNTKSDITKSSKKKKKKKGKGECEEENKEIKEDKEEAVVGDGKSDRRKKTDEEKNKYKEGAFKGSNHNEIEGYGRGISLY